MNSIYASNLSLSLFGESHGEAIGIVLDGFPPGVKVDHDFIGAELARRRPGQSKFDTKRNEKDEIKIVSGVFNGYSTGTPICGLIYNGDTRSKDYEKLKNIPRPGHSDYGAKLHYKGFNDYRGGGHFSGRLTAPLVFAGALAKLYLNSYSIDIATQVKSIGQVKNKDYQNLEITKENLAKLRSLEFSVLNERIRAEMEAHILAYKKNGDSIGGEVEFIINNVPAGIGNPFFHSLESTLSSLYFSIPAVKGVSFGSGEDLGARPGSENNDEYYYDEAEKINLNSNNNGGILGGISNGAPIRGTLIIKSTASISKPQKSINLQTKENVDLVIEGRHDPCIIKRALPVIEAMSAIGIMDAILENKKWGE